MVHYSKRTYECHFLYETDPKLGKFFIWEEIRQKHWCNWSQNTLEDYAEVCA